jgi:O-antigen/teichoic acid export membrane protein
MKLFSILRNKTIKNAGYLIVGKVVQMLFGLIVGLLTARYLGPSNYGLINYANAYIGFFTALCTLGINNVLVKEFVDHPGRRKSDWHNARA